MQYLLLIHRNEADMIALPDAERATMMAEYVAFNQSIVESGHLRSGDRLHPVAAATTIQVRNGKTLRTDGPFAETREQIGGYYLIDAKDLDEAAAIAARIPGAKDGSIEVRPVWAMR